MEIQSLWGKLPLPKSLSITFKRDIAEGKVPELPFFIVGQSKVKKQVEHKLSQIDSERMVTNLVIADYGNGKTNLLKYLLLFFRTHQNYGISVQYSRADVERPDLVLYLLKIIQDQYFDDLVSIIQTQPNPEIISSFVNNYESNFREIKEYTLALFNQDNSLDDIKELIYLGTGRFYNKRYFDRRGLEQLKDFNRREILVLLLNILSHGNKYVIFAIDEIEKIREKSKIRFNHFLTSYRELVDLFNQIKGHYLIVSFTTGIGESEISAANDALYTRIKPDVIQIEALTKREDILQLIEYLNEVFESGKDSNEIYASYIRNKASSNRLAIQVISNLLHAQDQNETLDDILSRLELHEIYDETEAILNDEEAFKNIHRKFFDPLEFYIESIQIDGVLQKQERVFVDNDALRIKYFIFNNYLEDFDNENTKIQNLRNSYPDYSFTIFSPTKLELSLSLLDIDDIDRIEIIDYDPKELFTLLEIFRENYDLQPALIDVISQYTKQRL